VFLAMLPEERMGTVEGGSTNLKITHGEDLFLADKLFQSRGDAAAVSGEGDERALAGKEIVVLGASEGIGAAICERARTAGARVHGFSRSLTGTDVADADAVRRALDTVKEASGRIDHVVNTAALLVRKPLMTMADEEIQRLVDVNVHGSIYVARAAYPYLLESKGSLLFFTSSSYTRGRAFHSVYSATKAAVVNLSQALAEEWMDQGIRVNCINPERTRTPMRVRNFGVEPADSLLSAERVADVSVRVLTARMTGHVIDVRRPGVVPPGWGFGGDPRE
jgi:2-C-methyl-D-erythritol 4-phosphate cytidylyltransferase